jgi:hypothetical protein
MFSNIKRTNQKLWIIKYRHFKKSLEHLTNDKFESPYIGCNSKEINS